MATSVRLPSVMSERKSFLVDSLRADEVEHVVLDLERKPRTHAERAKRRDLRLGATTNDGADRQRHGARVVRRLVVGHQQVVLDGEVEAVVSRPADVERLALDGASGHVDEFGEHAQFDGVVETGVVNHGAGDQ